MSQDNNSIINDQIIISAKSSKKSSISTITKNLFEINFDSN